MEDDAVQSPPSSCGVLRTETRPDARTVAREATDPTTGNSKASESTVRGASSGPGRSFADGEGRAGRRPPHPRRPSPSSAAVSSQRLATERRLQRRQRRAGPPARSRPDGPSSPRQFAAEGASPEKKNKERGLARKDGGSHGDGDGNGDGNCDSDGKGRPTKGVGPERFPVAGVFPPVRDDDSGAARGPGLIETSDGAARGPGNSDAAPPGDSSRGRRPEPRCEDDDGEDALGGGADVFAEIRAHRGGAAASAAAGETPRDGEGASAVACSVDEPDVVPAEPLAPEMQCVDRPAPPAVPMPVPAPEIRRADWPAMTEPLPPPRPRRQLPPPTWPDYPTPQQLEANLSPVGRDFLVSRTRTTILPDGIRIRRSEAAGPDGSRTATVETFDPRGGGRTTEERTEYPPPRFPPTSAAGPAGADDLGRRTVAAASAGSVARPGAAMPAPTTAAARDDGGDDAAAKKKGVVAPSGLFAKFPESMAPTAPPVERGARSRADAAAALRNRDYDASDIKLEQENVGRATAKGSPGVFPEIIIDGRTAECSALPAAAPEVFPAAGPEQRSAPPPSDFGRGRGLEWSWRWRVGEPNRTSSARAGGNATETGGPFCESAGAPADGRSRPRESGQRRGRAVGQSGAAAPEEAGDVVLPGFVADDGGGGRRPREMRAERSQRIRERLMAGATDAVAVVKLPDAWSMRRDVLRCRGKRRAVVCVAIASLLGAVLAAILATRASDEPTPPSPSPTPTPMASPATSPLPTSKRFQLLKSVLESASSRKAFEDTSSPQHSALLWLADEDKRELDWRDTANVTQRFALATIYFATRGKDSWEEECNFLSEKHECEWNQEVPGFEFTIHQKHFPFKGAFCFTGQGIIEGILLPRNNLTGSLTNEIGLLLDLHFLGMWGNQLESSIATTTGNLRKLQHLGLHENALSGNLPPSLGNLTDLQSLDLHNNTLAGTLPSTVGGLVGLSSLDLSFNNLTGPIPSTVGNLRQLKELALHENLLSGKIPPSLGELSGLQKLVLHVNRLTGPIPSSLDRMSQLMVLYLAYNELSGTMPSSLNELKQLKGIFLNSNFLDGTMPFAVASFPNLEILSLSDNSLSGIVSESIFSFENLVMLDLSRNNLVGTLPSQVGNLRQLGTLDVGMNFLHGTFPSWVTSLESLWWLSFAGYKIPGSTFHGSIPQDVGNLRKLKRFYLVGNSFTGTLPDTMGNFALLQDLQIAGNYFVGTVPRSFLRLTSLNVLRLENNSFTGDLSFLCDTGNRFNMLVADCRGSEPEVTCDECCTFCCNDETAGEGDHFGCFLP